MSSLARASVLRGALCRARLLVHAFAPAECASAGALPRSTAAASSAVTACVGTRGLASSSKAFDVVMPQTFRLDDLRDLPGAKKRQRRKGRGVGSGHGLARSGGEGSKGQKSHQGGGIPLGYEGGQSPLWRRTPKFGYMPRMFRRELDEVNLDQLQLWIDQGRIDTSKCVQRGAAADEGRASCVRRDALSHPPRPLPSFPAAAGPSA